MATSIKFQGVNCTLSPPSKIIGMQQKTGGAMHALSDKTQVVTCWRLSAEELAEIAETGVVWMRIKGQEMPPTSVSGLCMVHIKGEPAEVETEDDEETAKQAMN